MAVAELLSGILVHISRTLSSNRSIDATMDCKEPLRIWKTNPMIVSKGAIKKAQRYRLGKSRSFCTDNHILPTPGDVVWNSKSFIHNKRQRSRDAVISSYRATILYIE